MSTYSRLNIAEPTNSEKSQQFKSGSVKWNLFLLLACAIIAVYIFYPSGNKDHSEISATTDKPQQVNIADETTQAAAKDSKDDEYQTFIVVLHDEATLQDVEDVISNFSNEFSGFTVTHRYSEVLKGFSFSIPQTLATKSVEFADNLVLVESIEEDQPFQAVDSKI